MARIATLSQELAQEGHATCITEKEKNLPHILSRHGISVIWVIRAQNALKTDLKLTSSQGLYCILILIG